MPEMPLVSHLHYGALFMENYEYLLFQYPEVVTNFAATNPFNCSIKSTPIIRGKQTPYF